MNENGAGAWIVWIVLRAQIILSPAFPHLNGITKLAPEKVILPCHKIKLPEQESFVFVPYIPFMNPRR